MQHRPPNPPYSTSTLCYGLCLASKDRFLDDEKFFCLSSSVRFLPIDHMVSGSSPTSAKLSLNNPNLTKSLQHLAHRCIVGDLSIFYRHFNGHFSQEIRDIIPVPLRRVRTTRSSTHSRPFQVSLPTSRALSHISSFIPMTCNL